MISVFFQVLIVKCQKPETRNPYAPLHLCVRLAPHTQDSALRTQHLATRNQHPASVASGRNVIHFYYVFLDFSFIIKDVLSIKHCVVHESQDTGIHPCGAIPE